MERFATLWIRRICHLLGYTALDWGFNVAVTMWFTLLVMALFVHPYCWLFPCYCLYTCTCNQESRWYMYSKHTLNTIYVSIYIYLNTYLYLYIYTHRKLLLCNIYDIDVCDFFYIYIKHQDLQTPFLWISSRSQAPSMAFWVARSGDWMTPETNGKRTWK